MGGFHSGGRAPIAIERTSPLWSATEAVSFEIHSVRFVPLAESISMRVTPDGVPAQAISGGLFPSVPFHHGAIHGRCAMEAPGHRGHYG